MAATKHSQLLKKDTKDFITIATIKALKNKKLSNITVSQICALAGVSRMAFYRNYDSIEQVLFEYYHDKITALFKNLQNTDDLLKFEFQNQFFNAFENILILSTKNGAEPIIKNIFIDEMKKYYLEYNDEYWTIFVSAGVYEIWKKWLLEGRKKPLQEIMKLLGKIDSIKDTF